MSKIDYRKIRKEKTLENTEKVLLEIDSDQMNEKISNWAEKFGFTFDQVKAKIKQDEMFRCCFIKDPSRQNFAEKEVEKYLKTIHGVQNLKKLPTAGPKALYILSDGEMVSGISLEQGSKSEQESTKSLDFFLNWTSSSNNTYSIYITHKYTYEKGGSQDNQYFDALKFLKNASLNQLKDHVFIALLDGEYYEKGKLVSANNCYEVFHKIKAISSEEIEIFLNSLP